MAQVLEIKRTAEQRDKTVYAQLKNKQAAYRALWAKYDYRSEEVSHG